MLFLFLDSETTGLLKSDQIMEIGAILVDLEEQNWQMKKISEFETLVKINVEIDDKISRITGIDNKLLSNAPKLQPAQELWQNWLQNQIQNWQNGSNLEKHESELVETKLQNTESEILKNLQKDCQIAIIGHSLGFDLGFLRREDWFLPQNFVTIDTLDLSKIFLPFVDAVNLEFLTKKLNLKIENCDLKIEKTNKNNKILIENLEVPKKLENSTDLVISFENNFHRAKFDAECSWLLLEYLLDLFVFCYNLDEEKSCFTDQFLRNLKEFLPLNLINIKQISQNQLQNKDLISLQLETEFETEFDTKFEQQAKNHMNLGKKSKKTSEIPNKNIDLEKIINLEGLEVLSFSQKLANWSQIEPKKLQQILYQKLPKNLNLLILQLFFIAFAHQNWSKLQTKLTNSAKNSENYSQQKLQNYQIQNTDLMQNIKPDLEPNLKLHTQKDLFLIAELFLENC